MKAIILQLFLLILITSCHSKQNENTDKQIAEETNVVDTAQYKAIFWIDKAEMKNCKEYGFRTVKAKVFVHENGKVELKGFVKKQSVATEYYIRHHLYKFKVSERMLANNYVQPGEQHVQLRCLYANLKGK